MQVLQVFKTVFLLCAVMFQAAASGAQTVTKISAGFRYSLFLKSDGSLWAMGENYSGQLGDGSTNDINRPELIVASNVTTIATGECHSLFLKSDGSLWVMGENLTGQLGDGSTIDAHRPEMIVASGVTAIAGGSDQSLFLKSDGSLWGMGDNGEGQLGGGSYDNNQTDRPQQIIASNVTAIASGCFSSLFLKSNGSLWLMEDHGVGNYKKHSIPEQIVASNVTAIAACGYHSLFLKNDGSLWGFGGNWHGELGDGTINNISQPVNHPEQIIGSNVTAIAAGFFHSLFLKSDGSLWAMGADDDGQLGDGKTKNAKYPKQIVSSNVIAIAAGGFHSLFLKSDGSLWAMGFNDFGELGDGTHKRFKRPKQIVAGFPGQ